MGMLPFLLRLRRRETAFDHLHIRVLDSDLLALPLKTRRHDGDFYLVAELGVVRLSGDDQRIIGTVLGNQLTTSWYSARLSPPDSSPECSSPSDRSFPVVIATPDGRHQPGCLFAEADSSTILAHDRSDVREVDVDSVGNRSLIPALPCTRPSAIKNACSSECCSPRPEQVLVRNDERINVVSSF